MYVKLDFMYVEEQADKLHGRYFEYLVHICIMPVLIWIGCTSLYLADMFETAVGDVEGGGWGKP